MSFIRYYFNPLRIKKIVTSLTSMSFCGTVIYKVKIVFKIQRKFSPSTVFCFQSIRYFPCVQHGRLVAGKPV